jgi:ribosomal protein L22
MERPMNKPQDNGVKNQPTNIVRTEAKQEAKKESVEEQVKKEIDAKVEEGKAEEKKEKKEEKKITKKEFAIMVGKDLGISKKHSMAICDMIRGKNPEKMIQELELIAKMKKPIIMRGEIPHRKGNIMSGRYPINASRVFIKLLKTLVANSQVNGIDNPVISKAVPNDASRPFKRGGSMRFKRTNVYLETRERKFKERKEENKEKK